MPSANASGTLLAPQFALPIPQAFITIGFGALLAADRPLALVLVAGFAILLGLMQGIVYSWFLTGSIGPRSNIQTTTNADNLVTTRQDLTLPPACRERGLGIDQNLEVNKQDVFL